MDYRINQIRISAKNKSQNFGIMSSFSSDELKIVMEDSSFKEEKRKMQDRAKKLLTELLSIVVLRN